MRELRRIRFPMNRLAVTTAGFLIVALLSAAVASAKKPGPHGHKANVSCNQAALVAAIDAANSAGGGTLNLAHGCDYQLTVSPDSSENGLPVDHDSDHDQRQSRDDRRDQLVPGLRGRRPGRQPVGAATNDHRRVGPGLRRRDRERRRHGDARSHPGDRQQRRRWRAVASSTPPSIRRASRRSRCAIAP